MQTNRKSNRQKKQKDGQNYSYLQRYESTDRQRYKIANRQIEMQNYEQASKTAIS